jgi:hypothetical protein
MHVVTGTRWANCGSCPRCLPRCLFAAFLLGWLGVPAARGGEAPPPSLEEIARLMKGQWDKVQSLYVDFEMGGQPVTKPADAKRYLLLEFFVTKKQTFAFKGNMRYYRAVGPGTVERIAPGVEPDWDAVPGGKKIKEDMDRRRAEDAKKLGKDKVDEMWRAFAAAKSMQIDAEKVAAFDGKLYRVTRGNGQAEVWKAENIGTDTGWIHQDYMRNLGRALADTASPNKERMDQLRDQFPDAFLGIKGYKVQAGWEEVDGHRCAVVTRGKEEKLWLDPRLNYGIRRRELSDPESGLTQDIFHNQDFVELPPGVWLPKTCVWERCAPPGAPVALRGKPLARWTLTISKIHLNDVPDALFSLKIAPGTIVMDTTALPPPKDGTFQPVLYPMPADESVLDKTIEDAVGEWQQYRSKGFWRQAFFGANAAILLLLGAVLVFRRLQRKAA